MSSKEIKSLLVVEDNSGDFRLLREMLLEEGSGGITLLHVDSMIEAEEHLLSNAVDIILLDLGLPDAQGLGALRRTRLAAPRIPLVVLTGLDDQRLAAQALQEGAQDYLIKGQLETRGLMRALRYAVERKTMDEELFVEKERALVTLNCIGDAVVCADLDGRVTFLNRVAEKMTGWPCQEASGRYMADVFKIMDGTSRQVTPNPMEIAIGLNRTAHLPWNCVLIRRDGMEIPIE